MKKLFFASVFALAMLTSCNNSESSINPEEQQHQTFAGKTTAKGEELPPLSPEEEKAAIEETVEILKRDREAELSGDSTDRKNQILCHTDYNSSFGHACVYTTGGYLVEVSWQPKGFNYNSSWSVDDPIVYSGAVTPRCNC